jgi:AraC-like DNA-binding protein
MHLIIWASDKIEIENFIKNMDYLVKHLSPLPRRFPWLPQIQVVGHIKKNDDIRHTFHSLNFSFITRGQGFCQMDDGEVFSIKAPVVLTQIPDKVMCYGPDEGTTWDELYLIYSKNEPFIDKGYFSEGEYFWKMNNFKKVQSLLQLMVSKLSSSFHNLDVDEIDRLAESMIFESLRKPNHSWTGKEALVEQLRQDLQLNLEEHFNFEEWAEQHHMSYSTFRRKWIRVVGEPPQKSLISMRINQAKLLLVETHVSISEISHRVGIQDPLYFSRTFKKMVGTSPKGYRKEFLLPHMSS